MVTTISLKLPAKLKMRMTRAARQKGQSTQRWMLAAFEHEVERRERFLAYVRQARRAAPDAGPVEELESRTRVRFWLEQISSEKRLSRMHARRVR